MESLQQWRSQQQSDHHPPSAKIPKLHHIVDQQSPALPLFAAEPNSRKPSIPNSAPPPIKSPRFGGFFSVAQWQELELQALIYKYMLAGAPIPSELISNIRRSLISASTCYPHPQQYQLPMLQGGGYWGRCIVDPEPGRCRRTDGKKWRCSRETLTGHKYCERHVNRGRNRSRKHVETPTTVDADVLKSTIPPMSTRDPSLELCALPVNQRPSDDPDPGVLRSFFDDWPRTQRELGHENSDNARSVTSATQLSISISGNCSSEFSLKLSTGNGGRPEESGDRRPMGNWSGWGTHGGPLAEALRSSASTPSPTSVLQKPLGLGSASEASGFSA